MSDIVERLRAEGEDAMRKHLSMGMWKLCSEAADEIQRLREALVAVDSEVALEGHLKELVDEALK